MQYFSIDEKIDEIYKIKEITSIKLSNIFLSNSGLIPLLEITYINDNNKICYLSYSAKEKYFDIFLKKVVDVYNKQDKNLLSSSFFKESKLEIDEETKRILESGKLFKINELPDIYTDKFDYSLLNENNDLNFMLQIAIYTINKFLQRTDTTINIKNVSGYKYNYVLFGSKNNINTYFPFTYIKTNNEQYIFEFGNLFSKISTTKIEIIFKRNKILVNMYNDIYKIIYSSEYLLQDNEIIEKHDTFINDELTYYEQIIHDNKTEDGFLILPWNALYKTTTKCNNLTSNSKTISRITIYIQSNENEMLKKESYSKQYISNEFKSSLILSEYIKTIRINKIYNDTFLIETYFHDTIHYDENYKDKLSNKYFYHICNSKKLNDITKENLININKENVKVLINKKSFTQIGGNND